MLFTKEFSDTLDNIFFCRKNNRFRSNFFVPSIFWVNHIVSFFFNEYLSSGFFYTRRGDGLLMDRVLKHS